MPKFAMESKMGFLNYATNLGLSTLHIYFLIILPIFLYPKHALPHFMHSSYILILTKFAEFLMGSLSSNFLPKLSLKTKTPNTPLVSQARPQSTAACQSHPSKTPAPPSSTPPPARKQKRQPSLPESIINTFDNFVNSFIDPPRKSSVDPRYVLSGNWAPVDELPPTECEVVEGSLPPCLDGAYIRNGPNPQFLPRGPYHLFDGDGMLHVMRLSKGKATLCSRYVKTYKYKVERERGFPVLPSLFSGFNGLSATVARGAVMAARVLVGQFDPANGVGLANTSVALIGGRLYALGESDLPYLIRVGQNGDVHTLGRHDFDGKLSMIMTAHPKVDPETGENFAYRYGPSRPFLTFFRINPDGEKQPDVPIFSMTGPSFLHDFAITKKYAIFNEIQIEVKPFLVMLRGSPVAANLGKVPRIGILPRYAKDDSEMRWFEVPGFNMIHAINAWDEDDGDTVVVVAPNILPIEHTLERMDLIHASIEKVKIELKTGRVSRLPISANNLDFGVINPAFVGRKNRFAYAAIGGPWPKVSCVAKLDIAGEHQESVVATKMLGPGCFAGEPFFIARQPSNPEADEDDGYVVTYLHNENTEESKFLVMDAKSPTLDTVAVVRLPARVPYGFHGLFVGETDLGKL